MEEMELTTVNNEVNTENPETEEVEETGSLGGVALLVGAGVGLTLLTQKVIIPGAKKAFGALKNAVSNAKKESDDSEEPVAEEQAHETK